MYANHLLRPSRRSLLARLVGIFLCMLASPGASAADSVSDWCRQVGQRLSTVRSLPCTEMGFKPSATRSVNGVALMTHEVPPNPPRKTASIAKPSRSIRILVIGGIHGDELTSTSIVFRWMQWLGEPEARQHHWRVVPLANPDGLLSDPPQRMNANGVDLNRNFATPDWQRDAHAYWSKRTRKDPRRFPGKEPVSEPETRWLQSEIEAFAPDIIVSIHAPYGVLDFDGPAEEPRRFGHLRLNRLGVYPGSLGNYGGVHKNVPVITIELPNANRMPAESEMRDIWRDMLEWVGKNIVPGQFS